MRQFLFSAKNYLSFNLFALLIGIFFFADVQAQCPHTLPFTENFSTSPFGPCNGANGGWTSTSVASGAGWFLPNTNYAGGAAPEAHAYGDQACAGCNETIRMISPSLNTTGIAAVILSFKHELYLTNSGTSGSGGITISVESSPDNSVWTQRYSASYSATPSLQSVVAETRTVNINGLTGNTLYIRFNVNGVMFKVWGWLIDDVSIVGTTPPVPTIVDLIPASACAGSGAQITISGTEFTGVTGVSFNGTPATYTVVSTNVIYATLPAGATTGTVTVTTGGGTATSPNSFTINTLPADPANPTGNSPQCVNPGVTVTPIGSAPGGETWYWQTSSSGTSTANSAATYTVTTPGASTVYLRSQNNTSGCWSAGAGSVAVTVNDATAQPGTISGLSSICSGSINTYSVATVNGATSYTWTLPNGWTGSSTTESISATADATSGNILVTANNACGSSTAQTLSVTVASAPAQPGTISGLSSICDGGTNTYSIATVNGATSYTWTLPNGWSGSSTTESISATPNATSGDILVTADNTCGSSTAQSLTVNVDPAPAQPAVITGTDSICEGATETYSVVSVNGATSYTWTLPNGWTGSSTTESIVATADATSGSISVTADNGCGSSTAQTINVTVNATPQVSFDFNQNPVCHDALPIALSGTPAGGTYSGQGTSGTTFDPAGLGAGDYVVTYTYADANGCTALDTATVTVTVCTGLSIVDANNDFSVYPNPFSNVLTINFSSVAENSTAVLHDIAGKEIMNISLSSGINDVSINTNALAAGVYRLDIISGGKTVAVRKVIRME